MSDEITFTTNKASLKKKDGGVYIEALIETSTDDEKRLAVLVAHVLKAAGAAEWEVRHMTASQIVENTPK